MHGLERAEPLVVVEDLLHLHHLQQWHTLTQWRPSQGGRGDVQKQCDIIKTTFWREKDNTNIKKKDHCGRAEWKCFDCVCNMQGKNEERIVPTQISNP